MAIRTCWKQRSATTEIPFDRVISVAVANAFKPHVATYTKAAEIVGVCMDEVLFIANHAFDCIGAKSAGMRTAFIDRRRRPFGMTAHQPDLTMPTMQDLADALVCIPVSVARRFRTERGHHIRRGRSSGQIPLIACLLS